MLCKYYSGAISQSNLLQLVLHSDKNIFYDAQPERQKDSEHPLDSVPRSPAVRPQKNSRMLPLLSDEEDQDAIEEDPNTHFLENQLELLVLRSRVKQDPSLEGDILRREKRALVIQGQIGFDKKDAAQSVQQAVQDGFLARAAAEWSQRALGDQQALTVDPLDPEQGTEVLNQKATSTEKPVSSSASEKSLSRVPSSEDIALSSQTSPTESVELDELIPNALFDVQASSGKIDSQASVAMEYKPFPLVLPKMSQNISPVKLLQTYLKRIDKTAKEEFHPDERALVLRFSSAKLSCRKVIVEDKTYAFPDQDTARNFLSLKALFSIPELCAEKASVRFNGNFREAWKLLEDEEAELQKAVVVQQVESVRKLYIQRSELHREIQGVDEKPDGLSKAPIKRLQNHELSLTLHPEIYQLWSKLQASEGYASMYEYRRSLPIASYRNALLAAIQNNQVTILCGETGCGKSTQLPTFILENELSQSNNCKIYVTEPRRISAISLANRVSAELGESGRAITKGESLLGFSIRLDSQVSERSRLIYATTGIVLRMLEDNKRLDGVTHLIIDEVHERSIDSDFLLIIIKKLLRTRRDLKVVLMSATLQAERFNDYFGGHCCVFNVPGRTFPVEQYFLEDAIESSGYKPDENGYYARRGSRYNNNDWEIPDEQDDDAESDADLVTYSDRTLSALRILDPYKVNFDLIVRLLEHLQQDFDRSTTQAILIFLPGLAEIRRLMDTLTAHKDFGNYHKWIIYALHSSVSSDKQQAAFDVPMHGIRKIVLATNIAETGITIPDITCVIDTGKHKESRFDSRRQLSKLIETFIAKANARQRMGRAGRVQAGVCFHLFSRARFNRMTEHQLPEFQRLNLDELALRVKTVQLGSIEEVLLEALDAPTPENVKRSINNLIEVGALDINQNLTPLGRHLAKLPVDATLGKLILFGVKYSCLDPCLVIAAVLSSKSPFEVPIGREREASAAKQLFTRGDSDFLTSWTAYSKWRAICQERPHYENKFCKESFLSVKGLCAIEELRLQYMKVLVESGILPASDDDRRSIQRSRFISSRDGFVTLPSSVCVNQQTPTFIELCLASAFYPNLINFEDGLKTISKGQPVSIHSSSVNSHSRLLPKRWLVFYSLLKTKFATNAHDTGLVDDYIVALFCGHTFEAKFYAGTISIDHNKIRFATRDLRTLVAIHMLRLNLERQFALFLEHKGVQDEWMVILADVIYTFEAAAKEKAR